MCTYASPVAESISSMCVGSYYLGTILPVMLVLKVASFFTVLRAASLPELCRYPVHSTCPTWTVSEPHTNTCKCGVPLDDTISCRHVTGGDEVTVLSGLCMTLNKNQTETVVGSCPFHYGHHASFYVIPSHPSELDAAVCGVTNRTGQLCGQCMEGTSPPVYSYYLQCVSCTANNWAKYLTVSLLPTTVFFLGALSLRLRASSPHMNGFILFCQLLTSPPILREVAESYYVHDYAHSYIGIAGDIYISYFSIWNMDFFRMAYSPFCLHPNASMLQVLSLDYIVAAYPLALIILTYTLVTLHYHNCRLVVCLWRPFLKCCFRFRRQWNIQNSLVDAFATFLLLSYVKFLNVSFDILTPSFIYNKWGKQVATVTYYDGHVEYFGKDHRPYAVLAIAVLLVFTVLPILLLCLYPCRWFHKFLNSCHLRCQALHIFMDAFQGCFKDGTNGTRDCRYFAAIYLITRVGVHLAVTNKLVANNSIPISILATLVLLLSGFHPYKEGLYNLLDIFLLVCVIVIMSTS